MGEQRLRVAVLGAGGHGRVILDAILEAGTHTLVGVIDDDADKAGKELFGFPILGTGADLPALARKHGIEGVALGIGDNYIRDLKFADVLKAGLRPVRVIHPSARLSRFVKLGEGIVIMAGAVVNPGTVIEDNACVNTCAAVDHDNLLERCCHVFPNATLTGGVRVGEFTNIGSGAVVNPYLKIGKYSYVGAGAVVVRDVEEGVIVAGVPAQVIKNQEKRPSRT